MPSKINQKEVIELVLSETFKIIKKENLPIKKRNNIYLTGNKSQNYLMIIVS